LRARNKAKWYGIAEYRFRIVEAGMKTMTAAKFKAQCLRVIERVNVTREPVVITKKGRAIVKLVPAGPRAKDVLGSLAGVIEIIGDIESPVEPPEDWEVLRSS
jgi:prevent-host-death family protein